MREVDGAHVFSLCRDELRGIRDFEAALPLFPFYWLLCVALLRRQTGGAFQPRVLCQTKSRAILAQDRKKKERTPQLIRTLGYHFPVTELRAMSFT